MKERWIRFQRKSFVYLRTTITDLDLEQQMPNVQLYIKEYLNFAHKKSRWVSAMQQPLDSVTLLPDPFESVPISVCLCVSVPHPVRSSLMGWYLAIWQRRWRLAGLSSTGSVHADLRIFRVWEFQESGF